MEAFIRLTTALEILEDDQSILSFAERLSIVYKAAMWYEISCLKEISSEDEKSKIKETDRVKAKVKEIHKHISMIGKLYKQQIGLDKTLGKGMGDSDNDILQAINKEKSVIGAIVRDLRTESIQQSNVANG